MLLRFTLENFGSFKDAVEFNTFPSSKSHSHDNHKMTCNHATALRMSTIYGANGAGKSNLLMAIRFLRNLVEKGTLTQINFTEEIFFKFDDACKDAPSGMAVEFFYNDTVFYYQIEFNQQEILSEELFLSKKSTDVTIFSRKGTNIKINSSCATKTVDDKFVDVLNRMLRTDMLFLSFFGQYYPNEVPLITDAYHWFTENLTIVAPDAYTGVIPHLMDTDTMFCDMVNQTIPELKTGIDSIKVKKEVVLENELKEDPVLARLAARAKSHEGIPEIKSTDSGNEYVNIVFENNQLWRKYIVCVHKNSDGSEVEMPLRAESDGTKRLIEYMPLFYSITKETQVCIVDEIERSIHPIMIKDLMRKLSGSDTSRGQLIFSTHESSLLDQSIFRPDEIWFAQKDIEQATQLYPLSDFKIHNTANIENGYLAGRYGGIPFLSNLQDLHW